MRDSISQWAGRLRTRWGRGEILYHPERPLSALLFIAVAVLALASPNFITLQNAQHVALQWAPYGVLVLGATVVILAGGADFSFAAAIGLISVVTAQASAAIDSPIGLLLAVPVGLFVGLLNGLLVAGLGMSPIVATLGTFVFLRGVSNVMARGTPIFDVPGGYEWVGTAYIGAVPLPLLLAVGVVVVDAYVISRTRFGLRIYAIGSNPRAALLAGVNPKVVLLFAYLLAGLHWALAGILLTSQVASGQPSLATGWEVRVFTAVFLGGVALVGGSGTLAGVVVASILLSVLVNGMDLIHVVSYVQLIISGLLMLVAIFFTEYLAQRRRRAELDRLLI